MSTLEQAIYNAVMERIKAVGEAEVLKAQDRIAKEIRSQTAQIAAQVCSRMRFENCGNDLRITIAFEDMKKPTD